MNTNKNTITLSAYHKVAGTQCSSIMLMGGSHPPQNKIVHRLLMTIMFAYSPKKNKANPIDEYSTLYPATNSASASGRIGSNVELAIRFGTPNLPGGDNLRLGLRSATAWRVAYVLTARDRVRLIAPFAEGKSKGTAKSEQTQAWVWFALPLRTQ